MSSEAETDLLARALEGYPATFGAEPSSAPPVPSPESPPWVLLFRRLKPWLGIAVMALPLLRVVFSPTPLPVYEITSVDIPFARVATPGSTVELSVRPRTAVAEKVTAQSFLACPGEYLHPWQPPPSTEITRKGFLFVRGSMENVLEPGSCQIWIVVARPGKMPRDLSSELLAGRTGRSNWQAVSATIPVKPR
jgi:hypothetical protein